MIREGKMPFKGYETYYRIVGENKKNAPIILLHGGPGSTHNYMETLDCISDLTNRPVISYDQLGCGLSYVEGHPELWNMDTWLEELKSLIKYLDLKEYYLLGQSWGGMLLLQYMVNEEPKEVKGIVLSSTLPASYLWGLEGQRMVKELPVEMQAAIDNAMSSGNYQDEDYLKAVSEYMNRHCNGDLSRSEFECLRKPKKVGSLAYVTAWGPNEFSPLGNLKSYDVVDKLSLITCPTLIFSGGNDLCTPYIAKIMNDGIKNSKWHLFRTARHMCFVEEHDEYVKLLSDFLINNEN